MQAFIGRVEENAGQRIVTGPVMYGDIDPEFVGRFKLTQILAGDRVRGATKRRESGIFCMACVRERAL